MPNVMTTDVVAPAVDKQYVKKWMTELEKQLVWTSFTDKIQYIEGHGEVVKMRRYLNLDSTPFTLGKGVTPPGKTLNKADLLVTVQQRGDYVVQSDEIVYKSADKMTSVSTELLGRQAGEMFDKAGRDVIVGGTSVLRAADDAGNVAAGRTTTVGRVNAALLNKLIRALRGNNARPWQRGITATGGIGTTPIRKAFPVVIDYQILYDIENLIGEDGGFVPAIKYPKDQYIHPAEVGSYKELRFVLSDQGKTFADAATGAALPTGVESTTGTYADVHAMVAFGENAVGSVTPISGDQKSMKAPVKMIYKQLGSGGTEDALDQRSTVGWKAWDAVKIKDQLALYRVEVAVSS